MSLSDLQLRIAYRTSEGSIVDSFYIPCIERSVIYRRAVGYFTSSSLSAAAKGLSNFLNGDGKMYLVASPHLAEEDVEAIKSGYKAREEIVKDALLRGFSPSATAIEQNRLACLAWLIAEKRLEIKIAVATATAGQTITRGLYHEKIGIFTDDLGNKVAFSGSPNETAGGLVDNFESIDVFWSWNDPQGRVSEKEKCFERLWKNETDKLEVISFPEAALDKLLTYKPSQKPTIDPESGCIVENTTHNKKVPILLRPYQSEAVEKWFATACRGIFEMATGTGKTKTALSCLIRLENDGYKFIAVVVVPYRHLAEQWLNECKGIGFKTVLCSVDNPNWEKDALQLRTSFLAKSITTAILITTYSTFPSEKFQGVLKRLPQEKTLIADEVHHLGAESSRVSLEPFNRRLGLSATPKRIYDPDGTQWLLNNVGDILFRFGLDKAVGRYLTPYHYFIHLVSLDDDEQQNYQEVMHQIALSCAMSDGLREENPDDNMRLGQLLRKRQEILGGARQKIPKLREILVGAGTPVSESSVAFSLFYSSSTLFGELLRLLSNELHLKVSKFTFEESMETRRQILADFEAQRVVGILAKKCLDEGVDIPATRTAYILASSSNPMEFVQRRGRVLRLFPGKSESTIHDFFVLPGGTYAPNEYDRKLVERELKRIIEFAEYSSNKVACLNKILPIQKAYKLLHL